MKDREYGRENRKDNDLFFTCSLIDYIARKTKNTRADVVNKLGMILSGRSPETRQTLKCS